MQEIKLSDLFGLTAEFLTWLYFAIVDHDGIVVDFDRVGPTEDEGVQIALGKRLVLRDAYDGGSVQATLVGAGLADNGEVLQAVRRGAVVSSIAFDFAVTHRVYSVTLNADGSLTGVKLPDLFTEPDEDEAAVADPLEKKKKARPKLPVEDLLSLRMQALGECETVVDNLFAEFLRRRVDPQEWANDVETIRRVVAAGLEKRRVATTEQEI